MSYTVTTTSGSREVEADEHRVEGGHHVFRRTTTFMGRPRLIVALRLPEAEVLAVSKG